MDKFRPPSRASAHAFLSASVGGGFSEGRGGHDSTGFAAENRATRFIPDAHIDGGFGGRDIDVNQVGILLMGAVLGWFLLFAVRRYKVQ